MNEAQRAALVWRFLRDGGALVARPGVRAPDPHHELLRPEEFLARARARGLAEDVCQRMHRLYLAHGERNAALPASPELVVERLRQFARRAGADPDELERYWSDSWSLSHARPPTALPPIDAEAEGMWPDESDDYARLRATPYGRLNPSGLSLLLELTPFLSPAHRRYWIPAVAEHATALVSVPTGDPARLTEFIAGALPLEEPRAISRALGAAIDVSPLAARMLSLGGPVPTSWRKWDAAFGFGMLLMLVIELDADTAWIDRLAGSPERGARMAVIELARGVFDAEWRGSHDESLGARLLSALARLAKDADDAISRSARFALGELELRDLTAQ